MKPLDALASWLHPVGQVSRREVGILVSRPLYLFCMVIAPLFCCVFFTSLMDSGLPQDLPAGVVDLDDTSMSRNVARNLDAFALAGVVQRYASVSEAREAVQRGEIYGFYLLPRDFSADAQAQRQPKVSFYCNYSYLIAGSLLFRDMKTMSELSSGAAARSMLYARGAAEEQIMPALQPIAIDAHPLGNPWLNYSVYLSNTLLPGVMGMLIMMITVCSIAIEIKHNTAKDWLRMGRGSIVRALMGKLLPQTLVWLVVGLFMSVYLYRFLGFPCHSGIGPMILAMAAFVLASQGLGVLMAGIFPTLRLGLSLASLWGVLSLSISGFSFPVMAMPGAVQSLSVLFPLRHYFLIYVNQALNGYSLHHAGLHYLALAAFVLASLLILPRLKHALLHNTYTP